VADAGPAPAPAAAAPRRPTLRRPRKVRPTWRLPESAPPAEFEPGRPELLRRVLWARRDRLGPDFEAFMAPATAHSPDLLGGMAEAVEMLAEAVLGGRRVAIFGDYDADGVTATALLMRGLRGLGAEPIAHIPHRLNDGYGLNADGLLELHRQGAAVVVSCDCGTNSVEVVAGRPEGQRLIVTDHHLPAAEIAAPDALLNPHRPGDGYPFKELSGAGVAYKLLQGLLSHPDLAGRLDDTALERLLQLVAIGAVADVVPLLDENRALVARGLRSLETDPLPGLSALVEVGAIRRPLNTLQVAFQLAPRINAAGRMDDARLALDLLLADDPDTARPLAEHLERHNLARREATERAVAEAEALLEAEPSDDAIVLADPGWSLGLVGLIAGRLAEAHHLPAFVANAGEAEYRGSARWVHGFNVVAALDACAPHLARWGGHVAAAGFACPPASFPALVEGLRAHAAAVRPEGGWSHELAIDAEVRLPELTPQTVAGLDVLAPFGEGNPLPLLCAQGVELRAASAFGPEGAHLKLWFGQGGTLLEAIAWGRGGLVEPYRAAWQRGERLDAVFSPVIQIWDGETSVRLELEDVRRART
jgi:single-stranded-DNA-specific exonuclease